MTSTRYGFRAVVNQAAIVRSTKSGNRQNQLYKSACSLGRLVQVDDSEYSDSWDALIEAALIGGLKRIEAEHVLRDGLADGIESAYLQSLEGHATPAEAVAMEQQQRDWVAHMHTHVFVS